MKNAKILGLVLLAVVMFTVGACGNDDDDGGSSACVDYCAEEEAIDCLGGMTVEDCETLCQALVDEETCGTEYEALVECSIGNMECNGGLLEVTGCDDESDAWNDCAGN